MKSSVVVLCAVTCAAAGAGCLATTPEPHAQPSLSPTPTTPPTLGVPEATPSTSTTPPPAPVAGGDIVMPDVSGLTRDEVRAKLKAAGKVGDINFAAVGAHDPDCVKLGTGKARDSSPGKGQLVSPTSPIGVDMCDDQ